MHSVREALGKPWVLDIDATIKPMYGRQEGAEMGCNPAKPGRPSHVLHTFWVGNLRLVLDVQVRSGKQHTSGHAKAALGGPLENDGAGLRAGLQLVELVLPSGRPNGAHGGHHEPAVATGRSGLDRQPRRTNHAVPHADARQEEPPQVAGGQYPHGLAACSRCCGAVQGHRPVGHAAALRQRPDRASHRTVQSVCRDCGVGVTGGCRLKRRESFVRSQFDSQCDKNNHIRCPSLVMLFISFG